MNWVINSLNWWQWSLLLAVPPAIISLYFLKLKRQPLEVPSTYLWSRTIEDLHVNSIWQKLRQNLLLFLQLLLLLLAIISLLRPSWEGSKLTGQRFIFLIDTSASMAATDVEPTRLESVKKGLIDLIDSDFPNGSAAMVVSFSDRAIVEQPFTDNRRILKAKIRAIEQTSRPSIVDEALRVAAGLANPGRSGTEDQDVASADAKPATLMVFSDGRFRTRPDFAMGNLEPEYHPIGAPDCKNIGITAFNTASNPDFPDTVEVFAQIENFAEFDTKATANLYLNDKLIDAAAVSLPVDEMSGIEFKVTSAERGELRLQILENDDFEGDNVAYASINPPRRAQVLFVTPRNDAIEMALATEFATKLADIKTAPPSILLSEDYKKQAINGTYDLIIYDQCAPKEMPQSNTYFIGEIPPGGKWGLEEAQPVPQVIDADYAHPLLQFISFGNILIFECQPLQFPKGGSMIVDSQYGPMLAIAPREGFEDLVQSFEILGRNDAGETLVNTNWHLRTSFPVFLGNVLTYLGGAVSEQDAMIVEPGQSVALRSETPTGEIQVESPSGQKLKIARGPQSTFVYGNTEKKGVYKIREGKSKEVSQQFSVNLFDRIESNILPNELLVTAYEEIEGKTDWEPTRRETWKYLLMSALVLLLIEWYIYNRRVYL